MKVLVLLFALLELSAVRASVVGIMDSGADISHKDLALKKWVNPKERAGTLDLDQNGFPGDVNGWDFTENSHIVFNDNYNYLLDDEVKTFFDYFSKYDLGLLTEESPEKIWLRARDADENFMEKVDFVGKYIHGTHVAGVAIKDNSKAKILSMKIIPTFYEDLDKTKSSSFKTVNKGIYGLPDLPVEEFSAIVVAKATDRIKQMIPAHQYANFHKIDVINQSFGISYIVASDFITTTFLIEVGRMPSEEELKKAVAIYFNQLSKDGQKLFKAAPNTLFAIAAGNDASDNDLYPDFPANVPAENKIVVAATFGHKSFAEFSNFGATTVDVAAPGVAILSAAPTNTYIAMSGTSMATPYVTNIIAAIKDINPALRAEDLKAIVMGTVDVKSWLKDKVRTSGIVNKARALKAAELSKNQTIDVAISKARIEVRDVSVEKSNFIVPVESKLNFKPVRPSLLIPRTGPF